MPTQMTERLLVVDIESRDVAGRPSKASRHRPSAIGTARAHRRQSDRTAGRRREGKSTRARSTPGTRFSPIAGLTRTPAERARYLCSAAAVCRLTRRPYGRSDRAKRSRGWAGPDDPDRGIAAARFERARQRKHSRRAESPILGSGWKRSRDVASPYCCSDEPARGPSACSRPGGGRLSKRITLVWAQSLRLAKHQRGSGSPASMASDSWIAASMRQSDAEIDTIAARPRQEPARGPVGLAQSQGERHSPRDRGRGCRDCSQAAAEGSLLLLDRRGSG